MPNRLDIEGLFLKAFEDRMTGSEQKTLQEWFDESAENKRVYQEMERFWRSKYREPHYINDVELKNRILRDGFEKHVELRKDQSHWKTYLRVAAAVAIIIVSVFSFLQIEKLSATQEVSTQLGMITKESGKGQRLTTILPDGTTVKLNSGAKIEFPERFDGKERKVRLTGEAFFDVVRDEKHPFIIEANKINIKVLGTSFAVKSDLENDMVAVKSGRVQVKSDKGAEVVLIKDQMTRLEEKSNELPNYDMNADDAEFIFGWTEKKLVFKNAEAAEVLQTIEIWFGVDFELNNQLSKSQPYTATYKNPTLQEVMQSVAYVYGFNYEIENDKIMIK